MVLVVLLAACDQQVDKAEIVGKYSVEYYGGRDILTVSDNGAYVHEVQVEGKSSKREGTWLFESVGREKLGVTFNNFAFRAKDGKLGPRGIWHTELQKQDRVQLCFIYDQDICFRKGNN